MERKEDPARDVIPRIPEDAIHPMSGASSPQSRRRSPEQLGKRLAFQLERKEFLPLRLEPRVRLVTQKNLMNPLTLSLVLNFPTGDSR